MSEQLQNHFANVLQKQMDHDMADLATEMTTGTQYKRGVKIEPAFQHLDAFERTRIENSIRRERDERFNPNRNYIQPKQPGEPEIMVVYPNE